MLRRGPQSADLTVRSQPRGADAMGKEASSARDSGWLYVGEVCDGIDLDQQTIAGQPGDLHRSSRRPMIAEHARVHGVHRLKIAHVDEEHAAAENVLQRGSRRFENRLYVLQALFGLCRDIVA